MNAGMKDMLNVMDKFLAMGLSLDDVMLRSTWNPAREINHEELGHLSPGAVADVAVLRLEKGNFGFVDMYGARLKGTQKLAAELTLRDGKVVYDLNGITRPDWNTLPKRLQADRRRALGCADARAGGPPRRRSVARGARREARFYSASFSGRIQMFRKRTGLPWSCRPIGPFAFDGS